MADTKISDLNALTYLTGTYLVPAVDIPDDASGTKKVTLVNWWMATDGIIPAARVYNSSTITVSTATETAVTFDTEDFDTDTIHDTGSNTSRLTCKTAGKYLIIGSLIWESNAAGRRNISIWLNNTSYIQRLLQLPVDTGDPSGPSTTLT